MPLLEVQNLIKSFIGPENDRHEIIKIASFQLNARQQLALAGESGAGKSTFLNLIAGIVKPDSGSIIVSQTNVTALSQSQKDRWRAQSIGYIFQTFNLLPGFSCLENVVLGMAFGPGPDRARAKALLDRVGLTHRMDHRPDQLSTGQQQRVAVARALANRPQLVLADEPTGNLDSASGAGVLKLIRETCSENNAALLIVSHDRHVLTQFDQTIEFNSINKPQTAAPVPAPAS